MLNLTRRACIWRLLLIITLFSVFAVFYLIQDVIHENSSSTQFLKYSRLTKIFKEGLGQSFERRIKENTSNLSSSHLMLKVEILKTCVNSTGYALATINKTLNETFAGFNCSCIFSNFIPPEVCNILRRPWSFNSSLAKKYRDSLNKATRNNTGFILTKDTTPSNKTDLISKVNVFLPKVSPLKDRLFSKCSVVGSSGILRNSFCGDEIDTADFVFRCNVPPISAFKADAGQKSNLTTLNPRGVIADRYKQLKKGYGKLFLQDMSEFQNSYLWIPSHAPVSLKRSYDAMLLFNNTNNNVSVVIGNYNHFTRVKKYWNSRFRSNPTTGIYLISIALSVCRETHAFGFWPFYERYNGTKLKYHYYDDLHRNYKVSAHNFVVELQTLVKLHQEGAIKLHLDKCSSKS